MPPARMVAGPLATHLVSKARAMVAAREAAVALAVAGSVGAAMASPEEDQAEEGLGLGGQPEARAASGGFGRRIAWLRHGGGSGVE